MRVVHLQGAHILSSSSFDSVGGLVDGVLFLLSMFVVGELGVARVQEHWRRHLQGGVSLSPVDFDVLSLSFGSRLCDRFCDGPSLGYACSQEHGDDAYS